jgi:hypothetical protein
MSKQPREPSKAPGPEPRTRTFDETFSELNLTASERTALVWHLAMFRARRTIEALLPETNVSLVLGFEPSDILRQ